MAEDDMLGKVRRFIETRDAHAEAKADLVRALGHGLGEQVIDGHLVRVRIRKDGVSVVKVASVAPIGQGGPQARTGGFSKGERVFVQGGRAGTVIHDAGGVFVSVHFDGTHGPTSYPRVALQRVES